MSKIKVEKKNNYHVVVATEKISKGDIILHLEGIPLKEPTRFSIQIGENEHLAAYSNSPQSPFSFFRYLNHSCHPNAYFNIPERVLIASKDIEPGEEVTFNYNTTEYEMALPFKCECGSSNCYGEIKGFKYLSEEQKKELLPFLPPHLKKHL